MSENYTFYVETMAELRTVRTANHPLRGELEELLELVRRCEAMWALEDRIERNRGLDSA